MQSRGYQEAYGPGSPFRMVFLLLTRRPLASSGKTQEYLGLPMPFRDLPTLTRVVLGSVAGAFIGFVCLIVGAVRFLRFQSRGGEIQPVTAADAGEMALYVVAFAAGGAFVGAVQPLLRSRAAVYRAAATAGAIVMIGVVLGVEGIERMSTLSWIVALFLGAFFGVAAAYGWHRAGDRL